ncbi:MAG: hypothetical protein ACRD8U_22325 [Pyrinomonadaceae bacterium]
MSIADHSQGLLTKSSEIIRNQLGLEPTGRPSKSTMSISEKLRRESIRLSQIQDISGCRLVLPDVAEQDRVIESLGKMFDNVTIVDRRRQPSHGYRAVHRVVEWGEKLVEIQVRTALQHLWAELSEKLSDLVDPALKYGGGNENLQKLLLVLSDGIAKHEQFGDDKVSRDILTKVLQETIDHAAKLDWGKP